MQQTYSTLFSIANKIQVVGDRYLKRLTSRQLMAMIAIVHLPEGETSLNNIARMLGTTKQSVKQIISILEKKGYVVSVPNSQDKRAVNIKITNSGDQVLFESNELGLEYLAYLFHDFSVEEIEALWSLLKKLYRFDGVEQAGFEEEIDYKPNNEGA
jgi:DNA-binding MarR family transcriptional regulator